MYPATVLKSLPQYQGQNLPFPKPRNMTFIVRYTWHASISSDIPLIVLMHKKVQFSNYSNFKFWICPYRLPLTFKLSATPTMYTCPSGQTLLTDWTSMRTMSLEPYNDQLFSLASYAQRPYDKKLSFSASFEKSLNYRQHLPKLRI